MSEPASHLYARQLLPHRNGYPLYFPEPPSNRTPELIERGTSIGDVGNLKLNGSFHFAFNIFTPGTDTAINCFGVPSGFHSLTLHDRDTTSFPYKFLQKSEIKTEGKYKRTVDVSLDANASDGSTTSTAGFKLGYQVDKSSSEAALLTMPDGAMGEDCDRLEDICTYSIENAPSWYRFINGTLGREAPNGSLYVVTGCDKSTAWGIATHTENSSSEAFTLEFTAKPLAASASYSCSWNSTDSAFPPRHSADPKPDVVQPYNQCLFIRGFKILLRERVFNRDQLVAVESITEKHSNIDTPLRQVKISTSGIVKGNGSWLSRLGGLCNSGGGTSHRKGVNNWIDNVKLDPLIGPYHPLDCINKHLLETNPQAQVAISHESDWWDLSPGATLATEDEIIMRLASRTSTIKSEGVFLAARASTQSNTRSNEGLTAGVDHKAVQLRTGPGSVSGEGHSDKR